MIRRLPLIFTPQPESGFTVTSSVLPELVTEGDTLKQASGNVPDALAAVLEIYAEQDRALPAGIDLPASGQVVWTDAVVEGQMLSVNRQWRRAAAARRFLRPTGSAAMVLCFIAAMLVISISRVPATYPGLVAKMFTREMAYYFHRM
jgi:antitoxin HicB